ncbi:MULTISPECIES: hypothetical protein [unclassified Luteococcus]|uniref:hypothetical protein n=1 Tax=unclassified Luteococcus TaxID=2639923 RepID=UPI00313E3109
MTSRDPEDTDARFQEIMAAEFGRPKKLPIEPFNLTEAMAQAEPDEPDEPFVPPQPRLGRPTGVWLACSILLGFAVVVGLGGLFGLPVRGLGPWAVAAFVAGLVLLFVNLPRHPRDPDDDGARV